ncbi:hypothetical protein BG10_7120 [Bacillus thuringiensis serovar morrisoni]|nr:hypothetical protein BG10_7120 [Bacillus thuringiensis serovar morrisoni]
MPFTSSLQPVFPMPVRHSVLRRLGGKGRAWKSFYFSVLNVYFPSGNIYFYRNLLKPNKINSLKVN